MSLQLKIIRLTTWMNLRAKIVLFSRLIVGQVKRYGVNLDVEGLEDDGQHMYKNTYVTKIRNTLISSKPYVDVEEDLDTLMEKIIKRTRKWV